MRDGDEEHAEKIEYEIIPKHFESLQALKEKVASTVEYDTINFSSDLLLGLKSILRGPTEKNYQKKTLERVINLYDQFLRAL